MTTKTFRRNLHLRKGWCMIAGRGTPGAMNWGFDLNVPQSVYDGWFEEIKKHLNKPVAITGGGGMPPNYGILKSVELKETTWGGVKASVPQAVIENMYDPDKMRWQKPETFTPFINSYQLWVI